MLNILTLSNYCLITVTMTTKLLKSNKHRLLLLLVTYLFILLNEKTHIKVPNNVY